MNHANPISVYSRFTVLPLIAVSAWSRVWIGNLFLIPLAVSLLWTFLNPKLFDKPSSTKNWASQGVFGEKIWQEREKHEISGKHSRVIQILTAFTAIGTLPFIYGLYELNLWMAMTGLSTMFIGKFWVFDRMYWLFQDFRNDKEFQDWIY